MAVVFKNSIIGKNKIFNGNKLMNSLAFKDVRIIFRIKVIQNSIRKQHRE